MTTAVTPESSALDFIDAQLSVTVSVKISVSPCSVRLSALCLHLH